VIQTLLALNAGSSSVKFRLFRLPDLDLLASGQVSGLGAKARFVIDGEDRAPALALAQDATAEAALTAIIAYIHDHEQNWKVAAVAHRIVHGGGAFTGPTRLTAQTLDALERLCPLAPLHQPHNLAAVKIVASLLGECPQIGCFDTAFHAGRDPLFTRFALDEALTQQGVRRYGFHGLSYAWIAKVLRRDHPELYKGRVIAAHLGNGASLCAMLGGRSLDTTMGMTALDGLPMGTRCGALDPGAVIYMLRDLGLSVEALERRLYEQSGLKGLSGLSNDVAELLASDDPKARFALDYFALKVAQYIAMLSVSLGGLDALVFTGGIGEHAGPVRDAILQRLNFSPPKPVLVLPANEERMMAIEALSLLEAS
jgi:acetate kinase